MRRNRRNRGGGFIKFIIFLLFIGAGAFYIYTSPMFERVPPTITVKNPLIANANTPIKFNVKDNVRVKSVKVVLNKEGKEIPIYNQTFLIPTNSKNIEIKLPSDIIKSKNDTWNVEITAKDASYWNFLRGNISKKNTKLIIDTTPPSVSLVANSSSILKGGTALVIYKAKDKNLKDTYVEVNKNLRFKATRYKKDGVYATLFVWPFNQDNFSPKIVAIDTAGNRVTIDISIYKKMKKYKVSQIRASDRFINGKIKELAMSDPDYSDIKDKFKRFIAVNEKMRKKNEDLIHKLSQKVTPINGSWKIAPFYPLKNATKVSDFGTKRFYYYGNKNNIISTSYHLGYDFASYKNADLKSTNPGVVVFASNNGIYGNMPLINHGFGLYTLYGHCSEILVNKGEKIKPNQTFAKTGMTGLALGDHVHFGVVVQGVEVYPLEWMSKKWINDNINRVFKKADKNLGYN
jgi:hypothetical protein